MRRTPRGDLARRLLSRLLLPSLALACTDGPTDPKADSPGIHVVLGGSIVDTVDALPVQALVVQVRRPDGSLASGTVLRLEAQPTTDPTRAIEPSIAVCALISAQCGISYTPSVLVDTTDADGRVKATIRLGRVAGRAAIKLVVPEFGMVDSATFTVRPGNATRVRAAATDTAIAIGATVRLAAKLADRYGNVRDELVPLTAGAGSAVTLNAATGDVTGRDMGTQWIYARQGTLADSTSVRVLPPGRLLVWSSSSRVIRLVDIDGGATRTLVSSVHSDHGTFPRFDPSRQRFTLHSGNQSFGGTPNVLVLSDTLGTRRDVSGVNGFSVIYATRQLADGSVLVAGRATSVATSDLGVYRVAVDGAVSILASLPISSTYGPADISPDGSRVAYIATNPSTFVSELRLFTIATRVTTVLAPAGLTPRFSAQSDKVAFLTPMGGLDGTATVVNVDGSGRRVVSNTVFSPGFGWSPDGQYLVGRGSNYPATGLRVVRIADGAEAALRFRSSTSPLNFEDYYQPDWR